MRLIKIVWLAGPPFLREVESLWPSDKNQINCNPEDLEYLKTVQPVLVTVEKRVPIIDFS